MNARSTAQADAAERDRRIASLEKSARDALDAANKAKDDLASEQANVARLKKERDEAQGESKSVAAGNGEEGAKPAAGQQPQFDMRNMLGNLAKGFDDPEQRKVMKSGIQQMVGSFYDKRLQQMGLSEADSKLVAEILGERNFMAMDKGRAILAGKTDEASIAQIRKEIEATKTEYDGKVRAVMGEEKFRELSTYEQTIGDRRAVDGLARSFERKGQPLDDSQREKLTAIMVEERMKSPSNEIPDLGGGPGMQMLMSDTEAKAKQQQEEAMQQRVAGRASEAGLSPDQVNTLVESQKRQNDMKAMGRTFSRAFLMPK